MSALDEKWKVIPEAEPMTKADVLESMRQAKWDPNVRRLLPIIIQQYNERHPEDPLEMP